MYTSASAQSVDARQAREALYQFANEWRAFLHDQQCEEDLEDGFAKVSRPSFYAYHEQEPLGIWLIKLHRYWSNC